MRSQSSAVGSQLEDQRCVAITDELLYVFRELVRELAVYPAPGGHHVSCAAKMPRQLDQVRLLPRQLGDVHHVGGPGRDGAPELAVAPPSPGPIAANVERQAVRIARRLRAAVEAGRGVRQRRAVPEEGVGDVGPGPEGGEPGGAV